MADTSSSRGQLAWLPTTVTLLSILSCYGTLAVVTALSAMGITLGLNVHIWALVILAFALLAVVGLALGYRRHSSSGPLVLGIVGTLVVIFSTYGSRIIATTGIPRDAVEIVGFAILLAGAVWDWQLKKA